MTTIPEIPVQTHDQTPAPDHEQLSLAMLVQLRQLAQSIPGFAHVPPARRRRIATAASLPDDFLHAISIACDAHLRLAAAGEVTGSELRRGITFARAYLGVATELEILARAIRGTVAEVRADLGQRALRVYENAKRIDRTDDRERTFPHLVDMKRTLNRPGKKRAPAADPPAPPATTTSEPANTPAQVDVASEHPAERPVVTEERPLAGTGGEPSIDPPSVDHGHVDDRHRQERRLPRANPKIDDGHRRSGRRRRSAA